MAAMGDSGATDQLLPLLRSWAPFIVLMAIWFLLVRVRSCGG